MKIYLAGSIAGGREFEEGLILISQSLEKMGHIVMTKDNVVGNEMKKTSPRNLRDRRLIMIRDKSWIRQCDAFIAEVSTYSHGVGYEHCYAESLAKPILFLRNKKLIQVKYSAFLDGTDYKKFIFSFYDSKNITKVLKGFFEKYF